jgi:hypothetical protein
MIYAAIASVCLYWLSFTIALFTGCQPFDAFWNRVNPFWHVKYHCVDEPRVIIAASVASIVQDFICCFMPVILLWKVQIPRAKKVALIAIFSIGFWWVHLLQWQLSTALTQNQHMRHGDSAKSLRAETIYEYLRRHLVLGPDCSCYVTRNGYSHYLRVLARPRTLLQERFRVSRKHCFEN